MKTDLEREGFEAGRPEGAKNGSVSDPEDDKRKIKRVGARLPVALEWKDGEGMVRRTRGVTRDMSQHGIYCYTEEPVPARQPLNFDVVIPVEMTAGAPMALRCRARTVRSDSGGRQFGVAAQVEERQAVSLDSELGTESERRIERRVRPAAIAPVEYPGLRSEVRDVSARGAFVADERPLPLGRQFDLRFRLEENGPPIQVKAVVRRVDPQIGMAVEFTELPEETADYLARWTSDPERQEY
jgi:PilZ domain